jgi:hypothetical protein
MEAVEAALKLQNPSVTAALEEMMDAELARVKALATKAAAAGGK